MTGNVTLPGVGTKVAADTCEVDGEAARVQVVKIGFGALGANDLPGDLTAVTSGAPLPTANTDLGAKADAAATSDTGTFSLLSLFKRLLTYLTIDARKDTAGALLPAGFDALPQTLGYTGSNLTTIAVTNGTNTWTQTLTYTGSNLTGVSGWVKS